MVSLGMNGSYSLDAESIDKNVTRKSAGNYALGRVDGETFYIKYVGRADDDVQRRLKEHLNEKYSAFKFSYATSPKDAFEKECNNFHDFGGVESLDNKIHPDRPKNANWKCPVCDIFDKNK